MMASLVVAIVVLATKDFQDLAELWAMAGLKPA